MCQCRTLRRSLAAVSLEDKRTEALRLLQLPFMNGAIPAVLCAGDFLIYLVCTSVT